MGQVIKQFRDGSRLEYDRGSFDDWCVYLVSPDGSRRPPRDTDYFRALRRLGEKHGLRRLYDDYVRIYEHTGDSVDGETLELAGTLASGYGEDAPEVERIFCILHMAMVAEERKANSRLGKRIKRLGIHLLLLENWPVEASANFMRGMGWRDIAALCADRGF